MKESSLKQGQISLAVMVSDPPVGLDNTITCWRLSDKWTLRVETRVARCGCAVCVIEAYDCIFHASFNGNSVSQSVLY